METNKINEKSELHDRYVKFPITNITLLLSTVNRSNDQLRQEIIDFNDEITKEELNINNLEERKMFLCYRYQTTYHSQNKEQSEISETDNNLTVSDIFPSMKAIFPPHRFRSSSQISLVCDIVILQIVLYFDISSSVGFVQNFLCSHQDYLMNDTSRIMYMQIMEHLLEFLRLRSVDLDVYNPSGTYIEILKSWIETYKNSEWKTLASIFPKLIDIFSWDDIVRPLWDYILHDVYPQPNVSYCRILPILSAITDTCFIPFDSTNYVLHDIYYNRAFWSLILKGLGASSLQYRKQALYIMKTAVNSLNESIRSNLITSKGMKEKITPFVCDQINISPPMDCVKEKFFLVYKALEQEQDDLVMPALIHVTDLIEANKKHDICSCFDIVWLRCIFEKILTHESTQVTKWGVAHVLKLDEAIFDVHFLEIFINTLNNTHLYECQSVEDRPEIVGELTEFFKRAQKSYLFKRFVRHINKNTVWEPLTIFYVIYALRIISPKEAQYCAWETDELKAIKLLVEKSLSSSSSIPSTACQIELLRAICNYVRQIDDLPLLADVLATFSCLAKETDSWNIITTWLSSVLSDTAAEKFIDTCVGYLRLEMPRLSLKTFAMMICLLYDANLIFQQQKGDCSAMESLNSLLHTWNMSFYIRKKIDAAEFISHLIDIGTKGGHCEGTLKFISLHIETTFCFLINKMRVISTKLMFQDYTKYTNIVSSHLNSLDLISAEVTRDTHQSYIERLQRESINLVKDLQSNVNMQYLYGLHILYLSQEVRVDRLNDYTEDILYILSMSMNICQNITTKRNLRERIVSEYLLLLSKLMYQYLVNNLETLKTTVGTLLSYLQQFLEFGLLKIIPEVAKILGIVIDHFMCKDNNEYRSNTILIFILEKCFTCITENNKDNIFWTAMQSIMGVIISNNFLRLPDAAEFTKTHIFTLLCNKVISLSKLKSIIFSRLVNLEVDNTLKLEALLTDCLFHFAIDQCNAKIDYAHLFIAKHLNKYYSQNIFTSDHNNFVTTRAEAIILLHKVISYPVAKYGETFTLQIIYSLVRSKNLQHRQMQILLILEPILSKKFILLVYKNLCNFIYTESNHSSVRLMQEWLMIRILIKNSDLHEELWSLYEKSIKNRPSCTISLASIVYHVAKLLSDDNQKIFIETALPYIVRCCLAQQCNARIYNQFILKRLYELMKSTYDDKIVSEYECIYQAIVIDLQQENSTKSSARIQNDIYFSHFHPIEHYSLQTIFYEFPRLTNMSFDEWISPDVFKKLKFNQRDGHPLQLYNTNSLLSNTESFAHQTELFADLDDVSGIKELIYTVDIELQKSLIIVASLVDQLPNLDDIAKICETFKIKALIVTNTDCVKNKELEYLSVSADKWLNMIQVKSHELQKFLLDRKKTGWSLIGVEETPDSVDLMSITFKEKTVFVLGNEKNGIPPNFIPLFDECVEILQVNTELTRPLSVHFTTAICMHQYIQHMLKQ